MMAMDMMARLVLKGTASRCRRRKKEEAVGGRSGSNLLLAWVKLRRRRSHSLRVLLELLPFQY
jgi:hypothetical protein